MQNKFIKNISPSVKLICLILIIIEILIAKSLYFNLFMSTFITILILISNISVNTYIKFLKNIYFILLILLVLYIIIYGYFNLFNIAFIFYKMFVILILIKIYEVYTSFDEIDSGVYSLLKPLKKYNMQKVSYNFTLALYFIKFIFISKEEILELQSLNNKKSFSFKYYFKPIIINSLNKLINFDLNKEANHYTLINKKNNFKSKIILTIFLIFFAVSILKEVVF